MRLHPNRDDLFDYVVLLLQPADHPALHGCGLREYIVRMGNRVQLVQCGGDHWHVLREDVTQALDGVLPAPYTSPGSESRSGAQGRNPHTYIPSY